VDFTASYSLKPARLKFPTAGYGLVSLWRLTAAPSASTLHEPSVPGPTDPGPSLLDRHFMDRQFLDRHFLVKPRGRRIIRVKALVWAMARVSVS